VETIQREVGTEWVLKSRPVTYKMGERFSAGFIAQEQITLGMGGFYHLVDNDTLPEDGEGSPAGKQWVGDTISRIAFITAALQDALARIEALEARCPSAT
jgi:hypothetical protein